MPSQANLFPSRMHDLADLGQSHHFPNVTSGSYWHKKLPGVSDQTERSWNSADPCPRANTMTESKSLQNVVSSLLISYEKLVFLKSRSLRAFLQPGWRKEDVQFTYYSFPDFCQKRARLLLSKRPKSANKISLHCSLCTPQSYGIFFGKTILHVFQLLSYKHVSGKKAPAVMSLAPYKKKFKTQPGLSQLHISDKITTNL